MIRGTLYRCAMRVLHRFGLHYAPRNPWLTNDAGWALHRCSWCGLSDFVATKEDLAKGPLISLPPELRGGDAAQARRGRTFANRSAQ